MNIITNKRKASEAFDSAEPVQSALESLPAEMVMHILTHASSQSIKNLSLCNRYFRSFYTHQIIPALLRENNIAQIRNLIFRLPQNRTDLFDKYLKDFLKGTIWQQELFFSDEDAFSSLGSKEELRERITNIYKHPSLLSFALFDRISHPEGYFYQSSFLKYAASIGKTHVKKIFVSNTTRIPAIKKVFLKALDLFHASSLKIEDDYLLHSAQVVQKVIGVLKREPQTVSHLTLAIIEREHFTVHDVCYKKILEANLFIPKVTFSGHNNELKMDAHSSINLKAKCVTFKNYQNIKFSFLIRFFTFVQTEKIRFKKCTYLKADPYHPSLKPETKVFLGRCYFFRNGGWHPFIRTDRVKQLAT